MGAQGQRLGILGIEGIDDLGPQHSGAPELGDLHEVVHPFGPEERKAGRKDVDIDAGFDAGPRVFQSVRQGVSHFQIGSCAGFMHVIAGNADAVELGHVLAGVGKDVRDDAHGGFGRIDIGVAHHVFFEDVVLDGAGKLFRLDALLFGGHDIEGHDGDHGAVHGHGDAHLVQGDMIEEDLHIEDGIHRHTGFSDVSHHSGMV